MANRTYEIMYIVAPETAEDDLNKLNEAIALTITSQGGTVANTEHMGRRKLAYPIDKKTEGHYVLLEVEGTGKEIFELERRMRVNDAIIRFITVRVDEDRKTADKQKAKRDARLARRNAASNRGGSNQESEQQNAEQNQ